MKKFLFTLVLVMASLVGFACTVCKKQQPKLLKNISHGAGPQSQWDYIVVCVTAVVVLVSLYYSIKWLLAPGEKSSSHIKHSILE